MDDEPSEQPVSLSIEQCDGLMGHHGNSESPLTDADDADLLKNPPPDLPHTQFDVVKEDDELPTSSVASSVMRDDSSSITSYSMFSKERGCRLEAEVDAEVPTNPGPDDIAIPAVLDLPNIPHPRDVPSLVSLGQIGFFPCKELFPSRPSGYVPEWIRESPVWIKRLLTACFLFLLSALFLILAVASRHGALREGAMSDDRSSHTSIRLEDIPPYSPSISISSPTVESTLPPTRPIPTQQPYPSFAPVVWQPSAMPIPLSASPTATQNNEQYTISNPPTVYPTVFHLTLPLPSPTLYIPLSNNDYFGQSWAPPTEKTLKSMKKGMESKSKKMGMIKSRRRGR